MAFCDWLEVLGTLLRGISGIGEWNGGQKVEGDGRIGGLQGGGKTEWGRRPVSFLLDFFDFAILGLLLNWCVFGPGKDS